MELLDPPAARHPMVALLERIESDVADLGEVATWSMDTATTADVLRRLVRLESRLAATKLAALAHAETVDVPAESGAPSTAVWLANATRTSRRSTHADARLAAALDRDRPTTAALAGGALRVEQAQAIVRAVDALPGDLDPDLVAKAEVYLVEQAALFDAKTLAVLGRRLMEVVAPDLADAYEAEKLEAEERRAAQTCRLTMSDDGEGSVFVRAKIPDLHAAMLRKALLAFAAPKHQAATGHAATWAERRPTPERLGRAFCELLESLQDQDLPSTGGAGATVVVTMELEALLGGVKAARLDTGERISAGEARRLACTAGLVPAVLGGPSVPLDLGRKCRFHSRPQRLALALRDGGCVAEGCDAPPGMTQAHHVTTWGDGGPTDLPNGVLLCGYHHRRAHDPTYEASSLPSGKIAFHRRT